jgi:hypothetical protein
MTLQLTVVQRIYEVRDGDRDLGRLTWDSWLERPWLTLPARSNPQMYATKALEALRQ